MSHDIPEIIGLHKILGIEGRVAEQPSADRDLSARIEASSLGTPAARRLRERTTPAQADDLLELSRLTGDVETGHWWQMAPLARWYQRHGEYARAEQILRTLAERTLHELAVLNNDLGKHAEAKVWDARANTLR